MSDETRIFQVAVDMLTKAKGSMSINEVLQIARTVPTHLRDNVMLRGLIDLPSVRNPKRNSTSVPLTLRKEVPEEVLVDTIGDRVCLALIRSGEKLTSSEVAELMDLDTDVASQHLSALYRDPSDDRVKRRKITNPGKGPRFRYWAV